MPCFGTTDRTETNAVHAGRASWAPGCSAVDIGEAVSSHFRDIGQSMDDHSVTFENAQARERTQVLMDLANQSGGLVIGTGDLSELALGWATYNGDHMSMYARQRLHPQDPGAPSGGLSSARRQASGRRSSPPCWRTFWTPPSSPELLPAVDGKIAQKTEDLVGPYELHDFFLYYVIRWGFGAREGAAGWRSTPWAGRYDAATVILQVAEELLPPLLQPAVQALLPARRPQGGHRRPQPPRRLADAVRRRERPLGRRAGGAVSGAECVSL